MSGSWRLVRIAGIDIRMHWSFLLLVAWIAFSYSVHGGGAAAALFGVGLLLAVFVCVVLHELGHALTAQRFGIETRDITLLPIGGVARLERLPRDSVQELLIAAAGPLVNVVIAGALFATLLVLAGVQQAFPAALPAVGGFGFLASLLWINVLLVLFNLLPAFPMDGGRILRAILGMKLSYVKATEVAAVVGQMMAVLFAVVGWFYNPWLVLIALFVFFAAGAEAREVRLRDATQGVTVHEAMMTEFDTLSPDDTIQYAADRLLAGAQHDFPVVDSDDGLQGLMTRQRIIEAVYAGDLSGVVMDVLEPVEHPLEAEAPLTDALREMRERGVGALPVIRQGRLVGLLTRENVSELIALKCAERGRPMRAAQLHPHNTA